MIDLLTSQLGRSEMKKIMAGSGGNCTGGKCCYDHNPSNCSACVSYCSGSDCDCSDGSHGVSCNLNCT